jgi:hypothetical protein
MQIVMKAKETNQYLIIGYLWKGVLYSDTLHASEINPCREWLDRVVSVKALPDLPGELPAPDVLIYSEAREYLRKLAEKNGKTV